VDEPVKPLVGEPVLVPDTDSETEPSVVVEVAVALSLSPIVVEVVGVASVAPVVPSVVVVPVWLAVADVPEESPHPSVIDTVAVRPHSAVMNLRLILCIDCPFLIERPLLLTIERRGRVR